jgi:hypothetical protein
MPKKWAKEAAEQSLPDMEVVEKAPAKAGKAKAPEKPARPGPSIQDLRKKYGGDEAPAPDAAEAPVTEEDAEDVDVVHVRNKKSPADPADDPGQRTIITSKKRGILGSQG